MIMVITVITAVLAVVIVAAPFVVGKGGALAAASAVQDRDLLHKVKRALVVRYIQDEEAFHKKEITHRAWKARKVFLLRRFIDTARRLDYLQHLESAQQGGES